MTLRGCSPPNAPAAAKVGTWPATRCAAHPGGVLAAQRDVLLVADAEPGGVLRAQGRAATLPAFRCDLRRRRPVGPRPLASGQRCLLLLERLSGFGGSARTSSSTAPAPGPGRGSAGPRRHHLSASFLLPHLATDTGSFALSIFVVPGVRLAVRRAGSPARRSLFGRGLTSGGGGGRARGLLGWRRPGRRRPGHGGALRRAHQPVGRHDWPDDYQVAVAGPDHGPGGRPRLQASPCSAARRWVPPPPSTPPCCAQRRRPASPRRFPADSIGRPAGPGRPLPAGAPTTCDDAGRAFSRSSGSAGAGAVPDLPGALLPDVAEPRCPPCSQEQQDRTCRTQRPAVLDLPVIILGLGGTQATMCPPPRSWPTSSRSHPRGGGRTWPPCWRQPRRSRACWPPPGWTIRRLVLLDGSVVDDAVSTEAEERPLTPASSSSAYGSACSWASAYGNLHHPQALRRVGADNGLRLLLHVSLGDGQVAHSDSTRCPAW